MAADAGELVEKNFISNHFFIDKNQNDYFKKCIRIFIIQENIRLRIRKSRTCNWLFEDIRKFQKRYLNILKKVFEYFEYLKRIAVEIFIKKMVFNYFIRIF
jgi:hypothetical protein